MIHEYEISSKNDDWNSRLTLCDKVTLDSYIHPQTSEWNRSDSITFIVRIVGSLNQLDKPLKTTRVIEGTVKGSVLDGH